MDQIVIEDQIINVLFLNGEGLNPKATYVIRLVKILEPPPETSQLLPVSSVIDVSSYDWINFWNVDPFCDINLWAHVGPNGFWPSH